MEIILAGRSPARGVVGGVVGGVIIRVVNTPYTGLDADISKNSKMRFMLIRLVSL